MHEEKGVLPHCALGKRVDVKLTNGSSRETLCTE